MDEKDLLEESIIKDTPISNELEAKLSELNLKIQELEITMDQIEDKMIDEETEQLYFEEYNNCKIEYKNLVKQRKQLKKEINSHDSSKLSQVSIWVILYGILMIIISFPLISSNIWLPFSNWLMDILGDAFTGLRQGDAMFYVVLFLIIFSFPLLLNLITWLLYNNLIKSKTDKKVFIGFWLAQGLMSLGMMIYMSIILFSN